MTRQVPSSKQSLYECVRLVLGLDWLLSDGEAVK